MRPKVVFIVTEDWYFCSHRLPLAVAVQKAGYEVIVVTRVRKHGGVIRDAGLRLIPLEIERGSLNPFGDLVILWRLIVLYRRERPELVHHVALKPVLYGSIAARLTGVPKVVNLLAGMGWLITPSSFVVKFLKLAARITLVRLLRRGIVLVQNHDDAKLLGQWGIAAERVRCISGSGVDLERFHAAPEPQGVPVVVLPARLLWDKGVGEFVEAARILRARGVMACFILAGEPDPVNPASIPVEQIAAWVREGVVEHAGWVNDMPRLLADCNIVCLPSYREGFPKVLTEAAAVGRPIVTTDMPGCREAVRDGDNGLLVPVRNGRAVSDALERLIADPDLRRRMGARGRERVQAEFGLDVVISQTLAAYREAGT